MLVPPDNIYHLTYCTNIHPASGWAAVEASLREHALALRARMAPQGLFGIGLRLSSDESEELLQGERLAAFRSFLDGEGLYVALLNGFPYGSFHRQRVKEQVFAPDWRDERRIAYTLRLVKILAGLLPQGLDGGVSTIPLSYKRWVEVGDEGAWAIITRNLARVVAQLYQLRQETGSLIHVDIEPEPDGLVESSAELADFFTRWLLPAGGPELGQALGLARGQAEEALREHVRACYDACHLAVGYEDPRETLARFAAAGLQVGRLQVSSALKMPLPAEPAARAELARELARFADSTYLHQVVERCGAGCLRRHPDLGPALPLLEQSDAAEWRSHVHVPVFVEGYGALASTQPELRAVLESLRQTRFTHHLELETYTWDVLPPELRLGLVESIAREYRWVLAELARS